MALRNVKGTNDYLPREQQIRNKIREVCESTFQTYGCKPLETPILNYYDLLASKYGGGAEILKEIYRLSDQGERELALRYDLTIPFAKVIGMNPEIRFPFKRYEIGKVFRDGPTKKGRLREFIQCDVDIVGVESVIAEAELMVMVFDIFSKLGLEIEIQYNNRKLLMGILRAMEIEIEDINEVILSLDKLEKIGVDGVVKELEDKGVCNEAIYKIQKLLINDTIKDFDYYNQNYGHVSIVVDGLQELTELTALLEATEIAEYCSFNPFLARGLNIYTGTVYEVFLKDGSITSSIGSGGRYDDIIGNYLGNEVKYPTVGISIGLDVVFTTLMERNQIEQSFADVFLYPMGTLAESMKIARKLRWNGIRVEMELANRKLKKALDYANKVRIPHVLILGENELKNGRIQLKDMVNGTSEDVFLNELYEIMKQRLR